MSIAKEVRRENYERLDEGTMEQKVLRILALGPQCGSQIMKAMKTNNPNNVRPRLSTMAKAGKVRAIGREQHDDGKPETVYEITRLGHAYLRKIHNSIEKAAPGGNDTESGHRGNYSGESIPQEGGCCQ